MGWMTVATLGISKGVPALWKGWRGKKAVNAVDEVIDYLQGARKEGSDGGATITAYEWVQGALRFLKAIIRIEGLR